MCTTHRGQVCGWAGGDRLPAHVDVADLVQSGSLGWPMPSRSSSRTWAEVRDLRYAAHRGAILDELRSQNWVPRSVSWRARDVERALERLGNQLQRTPTDA